MRCQQVPRDAGVSGSGFDMSSNDAWTMHDSLNYICKSCVLELQHVSVFCFVCVCSHGLVVVGVSNSGDTCRLQYCQNMIHEACGSMGLEI